MTTKLLRRSTARLTGLIATLALTAGLTAAPASADAGPSYVGLGDSYAAGIGGGEYRVAPEGVPTPCFQTEAAYAAALYGLNLACSGATTTDVSSNVTTAARKASTARTVRTASHIIVTVGANDIDAAGTTAACAGLASTPQCQTALANALAVKLPMLPAKIKSMVNVIKSKAPRAEVALTGYPRLFTITDAMSVEQKLTANTINAAVDLLNATIASSALVNRVKYISVTKQFLNHGLGSTDPWIVGPSGFCIPDTCAPADRPGDVFHPTAKGHEFGYALTIKAALAR